jgi:hypothetical protein
MNHANDPMGISPFSNTLLEIEHWLARFQNHLLAIIAGDHPAEIQHTRLFLVLPGIIIAQLLYHGEIGDTVI